MGRLRDIGRPRHRPKFPERYDIIYADPLWDFGISVSVAAGNRSPENHYPCMATDDICRLSVRNIAANDAAWTTNAHLEHALQVIEAWGFTYKSNMVWAKDRIALGVFFRTKHEILLLAIKGKFRAPETGDRPPSVIEAPRRRHSQKPDEVYEYIERMYPNPRLHKLDCSRGIRNPDGRETKSGLIARSCSRLSSGSLTS